MIELIFKVHNGWSRIETIILVAVLIAVVLTISYPLRIEKRIEIGMTTEKVIHAIREAPQKRETELIFCKNHVWYGDCEGAKKSGALEFLLWKVGIDTYFVVGVDGQGKVVFKGIGDT